MRLLWNNAGYICAICRHMRQRLNYKVECSPWPVLPLSISCTMGHTLGQLCYRVMGAQASPLPCSGSYTSTRCSMDYAWSCSCPGNLGWHRNSCPTLIPCLPLVTHDIGIPWSPPCQRQSLHVSVLTPVLLWVFVTAPPRKLVQFFSAPH